MYRPSPGSGGGPRPKLNPAVSKPFTSPVISSRAAIPASNRPAMAASVPAPLAQHQLQQDRREMPPPASPAIPAGRHQPERNNVVPEPPQPQPVRQRVESVLPPPPQQKSARQQQQRDAMPPPPPPQSRSTIMMAESSAVRRRTSSVNLNVPPPSGSWRSGSRVGKAIFECGLALYPDKSPELYVEGSIFRREFSKRLQNNESNEVLPVNDVVEFVTDFISDRGRFLYALMPSQLRRDDGDDDEDGNVDEMHSFMDQQQSFLRMLLGVDALQQDIAERLLEKLVDITDPINPADSRNQSTAAAGVDMPFMVVSQFKWLEHIVNPEKMINLFLEAINLDERRGFSRELISALPEIFGDAQHGAIVEKLRPFLDSVQSTYLADVLDVFSNLNLEINAVDELRDYIMNSLNSMSVDCFPAALKFILSTLTPENAFNALCQIRSQLDLDDEDFIATYSNEQKQSLFKLIFNELKSALLLNSCQLTSWTKLYTQQPPTGTPDDVLQTTYQIRPFDFTMLVILHAVSFKKKAIENVLRIRRRLGLLSDKSVQAAFKQYHEVLGDHLRSVVGIADSCVRSNDSTICSFGRLVYSQAFCGFDNVCVRQDIVANLVSHVFSLPISSTNCAMDILLALSEEKPELLVCFRVFVRNMLDVLDNLHLSDVRKLYRILANLAFADSVALSAVERVRFKDDLYLIIRKQLAFSGPENGKYRQFGVLAAAMLARGIGQWAQRNPNLTLDGTSDGANRYDGPSTSSDTSVPANGISREITQLFDLVQRSVASGDLSKSKDTSSLGLFYDEISVLVTMGCLPIECIQWLVETLPLNFARDFLRDDYDARKPLVTIDGLRFEPNAFSLLPDSGDEKYSTISLFEHAASCILSNGRKGFEIFHMCPLFRLVSACCKAVTGSVDNMAGQLLGAIDFPTFRSLARLSRGQVLTLTEQYAICESLLALCNWFRELLSIFGGLDDPEMRGHCLRRLHDLVEATIELEKFSKACVTWAPLYLTSSVFHSASLKAKAAGRPAAKGKQGGKKNAAKKPKIAPTAAGTQAAKSQIPLQSQAPAMTQTQGATSSNAGSTNWTVLARYRIAFRELSLDSLKLIAGEINSRHSQGMQGSESVHSVLQLSASSANSSFSTIFTPQEALYLVEDLIEKLRYKLIKSGSKSFSSFPGTTLSQASEIINRCLDEKSTEDVLEAAVDLVGALCSLLQGCYVMLREALNESEGVIDNLQERAEWVAGLRLYGCIFDCFSMLLVNIPQLCPKLVSRLVYSIANSPVANSTADEIRTPHGDMVVLAFNWLTNFSDTMPTLLITGSYLRTLEALFTLCKRGNDRDRLGGKLHDICAEMMKADWTDLEKTPATPSYKVIPQIFQLYLIRGRDSLSVALENFLLIITDELMAEGGGPDTTSITFRLLSRRTFPAFYEVLLAHLVRLAQTVPALDREGFTASQQHQQQQAIARAQRAEDNFLSQRHHVIPDGEAFGHREMVQAWDNLGALFRDTVELTRTFENRACLVSVLKHGRTFLEIFSKRAMPLLDMAFHDHPAKVKEVLSVLQKGTRLLHIICSESKSHKEVSVIAQVPRMKKTLEAFIFRVKQMLSVNNCLSVMTVGVLKARNIKGDEISSQNPYVNEEEDEEGAVDKRPKRKHSVEGSGGKKSQKGGGKSRAKSSASQRSDGNEDSNETVGDDDEEDEDGEETVNADDSDEDQEEDSGEEGTTVGDSQFDDAVDTLGSSSSSSRRKATKAQPASKTRKRHSYSTAYDHDETVEGLDDDEDDDNEEETADDEEVEAGDDEVEEVGFDDDDDEEDTREDYEDGF